MFRAAPAFVEITAEQRTLWCLTNRILTATGSEPVPQEGGLVVSPETYNAFLAAVDSVAHFIAERLTQPFAPLALAQHRLWTTLDTWLTNRAQVSARWPDDFSSLFAIAGDMIGAPRACLFVPTVGMFWPPVEGGEWYALHMPEVFQARVKALHEAIVLAVAAVNPTITPYGKRYFPTDHTRLTAEDADALAYAVTLLHAQQRWPYPSTVQEFLRTPHVDRPAFLRQQLAPGDGMTPALVEIALALGVDPETALQPLLASRAKQTKVLAVGAVAALGILLVLAYPRSTMKAGEKHAR